MDGFPLVFLLGSCFTFLEMSMASSEFSGYSEIGLAICMSHPI